MMNDWRSITRIMAARTSSLMLTVLRHQVQQGNVHWKPFAPPRAGLPCGTRPRSGRVRPSPGAPKLGTIDSRELSWMLQEGQSFGADRRSRGSWSRTLCSMARPSRTWSRTPQRQIQPIRRAGTPTISAKGGTSLRTTAPAPIKLYSPRVMPHNIVALAPIDAPRRTRVVGIPTCGRCGFAD